MSRRARLGATCAIMVLASGCAGDQRAPEPAYVGPDKRGYRIVVNAWDLKPETIQNEAESESALLVFQGVLHRLKSC